MRFDLKQCMEQDGGKCISVSDNGRLDARILCDSLTGPYTLAVAVMEIGTENIYKYLRGGALHIDNRYTGVFLENIQKPHEVNVFILQHENGGVVNYVTSLDGITGFEILASKKITLNEGEFF